MNTAILVFLMIALVSTGAMATNYTVTNLGCAEGGNYSWGDGINNYNQVVGLSNGNGYVPTTWSQSGMQQLARTGEIYNASPVSVNDFGQVVGYTTDTGLACFWDDSGSHLLSALGGRGNRGHANDINNEGVIVGYSYNAITGDQQACIWSNGVIRALEGGVEATAINSSGVVVGSAVVGGRSQACYWDSDGIHYLSDLGGNMSEAQGINDSGQIVGYAMTIGGDFYHACLWDGLDVHDLGTAGGLRSYGRDINNSGIVVGTSELLGGGYCGWYWNGTLNVLPSLGGENTDVSSINDFGFITGGSDLPTHPGTRAVLWQPVPEPSSLLALSGGLLGIIGFIRRRA